MPLDAGGWELVSDRSPPRPHVNLVAETRHALAPHEVVEVGAHYDTVVGTVGADETIESALVIDSIGYADHAPDSQDTPFIRIPLVFWLPTVADFLALGGNWPSGSVADDFERDAGRYEPGLPLYAAKRLAGLTEVVDRSEVGNYWEAGIPAIFIGDTSNYRSLHYHRPSDTPETLDYGFLARVARVCGAWLLERAGLPPPTGPPAG